MIKRYSFFLVLAVLNVLLYVFYPHLGQKSLEITWQNTLEMLSILPPVFILLGLLDVWVERETMMKYTGKDSGFLGVVIAFVLGSAAAGPLYAAFPIAGVLLKKGSSFTNVLVFIGAWSTTKIPLLLFESSSLGWKFMLTRLAVNILGIGLIAYLTGRLMSEAEKKKIFENALKETK